MTGSSGTGGCTPSQQARWQPTRGSRADHRRRRDGPGAGGGGVHQVLAAVRVPVLARTPGSLLAAGVEAVEFTGRDGELAELAAWRDNGEGFAVMLVAG